MTETTQFTIGARAACTDGACGAVIRIVVDPVARAVTHLVVEPEHRQGLGRLVPIALAEVTADGVRLGCTVAEFSELEWAEETHFVPGGSAWAAYGPGRVLAWPYYGGLNVGGVGGDGVGVGGVGGDGSSASAWIDSQVMISDAVPPGEVAVRRGEPVRATDGDIGRVQGLVIDRDSHRVTHVLLQEGHLWGRKEVAVPIGAVTGVQDGVRLRLTRQEVQDLPPAAVDHQDG
jgi:sporulation protein YlmC with PRC-barrel domain